MTENIKNTAITAAGYIYQNRQGLRVLCDWLDAPSRYAKVKFECDVEADAPTGLDDIVVERMDGLQDLKQIKFTPNPDAHPLSWDWLLEKSGKTERSRYDAGRPESEQLWRRWSAYESLVTIDRNTHLRMKKCRWVLWASTLILASRPCRSTWPKCARKGWWPVAKRRKRSITALRIHG